MPLSRLAIALAGVLAAACLNVSAPGAAARGCGGPAGYAYAGLASDKGATSVSAGITTLGQPLVQSGHVAGWVGLGGPGEGPGGTTQWIQVGLNTIPGSANKLYVEVAHPNGKVDYADLDTNVPLGVERQLSVVEVADQPNFWRVWIDGRAVGSAVYLPSSHRALTPMAVAENWDGGQASCNRYAYRFTGVKVSGHAMANPQVLQDPGYRLVRSGKLDFTAATQGALPQTEPRSQASSTPVKPARPPAQKVRVRVASDDGLGTN